MKRTGWFFVGGLLVALLLAGVVSNFASGVTSRPGISPRAVTISVPDGTLARSASANFAASSANTRPGVSSFIRKLSLP